MEKSYKCTQSTKAIQSNKTTTQRKQKGKKINKKQFSSQTLSSTTNGMDTLSSVASPKIWEGQNVRFQANTTIFFGIPPLKAQNDYVFQTFLGVMAPLGSPLAFTIYR